MQTALNPDALFGQISIEKNLISKEDLERAVVVQKCIFNRTQITPPIGKVLQKMGMLTEAQLQGIAAELEARSQAPIVPVTAPPSQPLASCSDVFELSISEDKIFAYLVPKGVDHKGVTLTDVKRLLSDNRLCQGIVGDRLLSIYLEQANLPTGPFKVASGTAAVPGSPSEIRYNFDTDPMRIGTLQEDGSMDWKNHGEIPQAAVGDVLAEKIGGGPGSPGVNVYGEEVPPPKIKEPVLKNGKGTLKSEDGRQIIAKVGGTPKLEAGGRIAVYSILPIEGDVGLETGHIHFDGHIEVSGAVTSGYSVKGRNLCTGEIQNATVEVSEDLTAHRGIYGATLKVGGNIKASHIHNSTIEVNGNLVVEKEIINCTIEANDQVIIVGGKIIASKVGAKKGIQVKDVGTSVSRPNELTVGVDFKYEREVTLLKEAGGAMETQKTEVEKNIVKSRERIDTLENQLGEVAQEQDAVMVQRRQMQDRLEGPGVRDNPAKLKFVEEMVQELSEKFDLLDQQVRVLMEQDEQTRTLLAGLLEQQKTLNEQIEKTKQDMVLCEEAAKQDPGVPVLKVSGTIFSKTQVIAPHKQLSLPEEMKRVKIYESKDENQLFLLKIVPL